jgi:hypothetical protein
MVGVTYDTAGIAADVLRGANMIRSVLAFGLLITLCASANAAPVHRARPPAGHLRPDHRDALPTGVAVPGWTDEQTRKWLTYPEVSG